MAVYDKSGKPIKSGRIVSEVDKDGARELALFAENTSEIYNGILTSVLTNLQRKVKKGIYDKNKAVVAWLHVIDEAAKLYDNWYGSGRDSLQLFNKATRMEAARQLMSRMDEDVFQDVEIESSKKRRPKTADERAKDEGADITCSRKLIKSSPVRCITFEQIVDSRFDDISKGEKILNDRKNEIIELCGDDFSVYTNKIKFLDWGDDESQYRQRYYIRKNNNNVSWNDLYKIVNSVKAVPYKFDKINDSVFESRKSIKSSFNYYDGFEDDVRFFAERYSDNDDIVEMVAGDIENEHPTESPEEFDSLMRAVHEELKRQGYFKQPWQVNSSRQIKSAIDGGWEVRSSDVPEALDLFVEYYGEETALEEIARTMSTDTLLENIEWIARQWGFGEDLESVEGTWNKYEYAKEVMGVKELFNNLTQAAGYDELAEDLAFIFRQYDFREWDKYDNEEDIYSSRINSSKEDKADEDGPHMKFKTLDEDTKFELREQIEDELEALLDKLNVKFTTDVWEETVQYILSFFEEDNAYNPKTAKQAVHEWYLDTKDDFPEMFDNKKQKVASARYCEWIRSKRLIKSAKKFFK